MRTIKYRSLKSIFNLFVIVTAFSVSITAAVPIPSGFNRILNETGVSVYQKNYAGGEPDYVTVIDMRYGTLRNFTGNVSGPQNMSTLERRSIQTFWNNAKAQDTLSRKVRVVVNGTFFATNSNPTGIAFGLKADWWRMSYGYAIGTEYPGLIRTFAYDSPNARSGIQNYSQGTFDGSYPNVIGGLDVTANKNPSSLIGRTFVGIRDDNFDGKAETIIIFSSKKSTQSSASQILTAFGANSKIMLDGGGSTGLVINGLTKITPERTLPQVLVICSGR